MLHKGGLKWKWALTQVVECYTGVGYYGGGRLLCEGGRLLYEGRLIQQVGCYSEVVGYMEVGCYSMWAVT